MHHQVDCYTNSNSHAECAQAELAPTQATQGALSVQPSTGFFAIGEKDRNLYRQRIKKVIRPFVNTNPSGTYSATHCNRMDIQLSNQSRFFYAK